MKSGRKSATRSRLALDRVPDERSGVGAVEGVDGDDSGRRGDVDLGQPAAADHIDPDEQQAARPQFRAERGADLPLRLGQLGLRGGAADGEVGTYLALARDAVDRSRHLAVDEDDAL